MRYRSAAYGTEVLNDNFSCSWTLCSTQSGDGWPQRSQLQPGVPSLGRFVTLLPATFCNLGLGDPLSSCNKRIVFISYFFLLGKPTAASVALNEISVGSDCGGLNGAERRATGAPCSFIKTGWVSPRLIPSSPAVVGDR